MKENNLKKYINRKERLGGLIYVALLFIMGMGICAWLLLAGSDRSKIFSQKDLIVEKIDRQRDFRKAQEKCIPLCDSLAMRIEKFNPGINAVYEENDIKFIINEMKQQYERNPWDKRYKAFYHLAGIYEIWFLDKRQLWSKRENILYFKKNIEECELGVERASRAL